jgi:hypothetical protein
MVTRWLFELAITSIVSAPIWVPLTFAAYAAGRRQYGTRFLLALVTAEAIALGCSLTIYRIIDAAIEVLSLQH